MTSEYEEMSGAGHRAMKESIAKLDAKLDEMMEAFDIKIKNLHEKLDAIIPPVMAATEIPATLPGRSNDELYLSIESVREVVSKNLLVYNKNLVNRVNTIERRLIEFERYFHYSNHNSRKNNLEIDGIPRSVTQIALEDTVIKVLNAVPGIQCDPDNIEACHRITSRSSTTIVKFHSRKTKDAIFKNRKKYASLDTNALGIGYGRIYINHNLTPIHKELSDNCRELKRQKLIEDTWTLNANVKIRGCDGAVHGIDHEMDLYRLFPNHLNFTFDVDFLANAEEFDEYLEFDD